MSAVVLTIGEETTARALASIERQTVPVAELVVVDGVTPAHRAINVGAGRVRTKFFIQVDADMIIDAVCVEALLGCMAEPVGLAIGHLRDPLRERILGVKLFRTECFARVQYPDTISASTDFAAALPEAGWGMSFALRRNGDAPRQWHTFGEHRPRYDSHEYTFRKFLIEGARCRYRRAEGRFKFMLNELRVSSHPAAVPATIALAHGLFLEPENDLLIPGRACADALFLGRFLAGCRNGGTPVAGRGDDVSRDAFVGAYMLGGRLRRERNAPTFLATFAQLRRETAMTSMVKLIGLCHGLFNEHGSADEAEDAFARLTPVLLNAHRSW